tara:strand:- start:48 stop:320 length:273 start_codon:yes stop_codon:yes gene_type:complete
VVLVAVLVVVLASALGVVVVASFLELAGQACGGLVVAERRGLWVAMGLPNLLVVVVVVVAGVLMAVMGLALMVDLVALQLLAQAATTQFL